MAGPGAANSLMRYSQIPQEQVFAESAVAIIKKFNLDGIDIDWEYPGVLGLEGNVYRPEDKQNYTLMFKELRRQLDELQKQTGKKYLLTTAAGAFKKFVEHTEMGVAQQYLDYINLMTYDYSGGKIASHHTALFSTKAYDAHNNADDAVELFEKAGVPLNKLVMGIAFYGRSAILIPGSKGLGDTVAKRTRNYGYSLIRDSILKIPADKVFKDKHAKADYIYNEETRQFITYEDEYSVRKKCKYVMKYNLGGVMFWEFNEDPKGYLLNEINLDLK